MDYKPSPFIFFLTLEDNLPESFYIFDRNLKEMGFILVPVKVDQLQTLASATEQEDIIVLTSIVGGKEFKLYNESVRGLLKYVLRSKRITMMVMSSFSRLNDSKFFTQQKNYYFLKYPLDARLLSSTIARYHQLRTEKSSKWPGGKRAGVTGIAA